MPKETGGHAFPGPFTGHCGDENHAGPCGCYLDHGMTLRDWFAGMALQGRLANAAFDTVPKEAWAREAYRYADAMITEREKE
jgi:hypothetical protein